METLTRKIEYYGPVSLEECSFQRSFGVLFIALIASGSAIQLALIHAIMTSPFHRKNVCYQSILIIGVYTLVQMLAQTFVSINLLACTNVGQIFNVIGGSLNNVSFYVIEPYSLMLAVNRLIIVVIRNQEFEKIVNFIHKFANKILWVIGLPPIIAAFHPTCHIIYHTYVYSRTDECLFDNFINGIFKMTYFFMQLTFVVYIFLVIGLIYQRTKLTRSSALMSKTEARILFTAFANFAGILAVLILRTYFIDFISETGPGRILYRFVLVFSAFLNAFLTFAFNKPLRNRIYDRWFLRSYNKRSSIITLSTSNETQSCSSSSKKRRRSSKLSSYN